MKRPACVPPIVVSVLMSLSACGAIGEKDFACPGRPSGVRCMSASEVYRATHHTDVVEATSPEALGDEPRMSDSSRKRQSAVSSQRSRRASSSVETAPAHDEAQLRRPFPQVDRPVPIRTPAQVMRVWIAPWEDTRGVLHGGEHAFIEVGARRWSMGERETAEPVRLFSIQESNESTPNKAAQARKPPAAASTNPHPERSSSNSSAKTGVSK